MTENEQEKNLKILKEKLAGNYFIDAQFIYLATTDSTNAEMKRRIPDGITEGTVIWAEKQEAGRGRLGRSWSSSAHSIACSICMRPTNLQTAAQYSFVTAVAVAEGIAKITALTPQLKWPNDVLIGRKKVCGILLELAGTELIIGIGININQELADFPADIQAKATSLALETGFKVERELVLAEILSAFAANHQLLEQEGFAVIAQKWTKLCAIIGEEVSVNGVGQQEIKGTVLGLREDGALLLQTAQGEKAILSGDVSLRGIGKEYI